MAARWRPLPGQPLPGQGPGAVSALQIRGRGRCTPGLASPHLALCLVPRAATAAATAAATHTTTTTTTCRDFSKAEMAAKKAGMPAGSYTVMHLDLASLTSVRQFVASYKAAGLRLDALVSPPGPARPGPARPLSRQRGPGPAQLKLG